MTLSQAQLRPGGGGEGRVQEWASENARPRGNILGREASGQSLMISAFGKPPASHQAAVSHLRCHPCSVSVPGCLSLSTNLLSTDCVLSRCQAPHLSDLLDLLMPRISLTGTQPRSCDKEAGPISLVPDQLLPWVPFSATTAPRAGPAQEGVRAAGQGIVSGAQRDGGPSAEPLGSHILPGQRRRR